MPSSLGRPVACRRQHGQRAGTRSPPWRLAHQSAAPM